MARRRTRVAAHAGRRGLRPEPSLGLRASWAAGRAAASRARRRTGGSATFAPLNTVAIECVAGSWARRPPPRRACRTTPSRHDGMLTKREVRAATLARLMPLPGQRLWDVGAGSGAVAIEWLRAAERRPGHRRSSRTPARCATIARNAEAPRHAGARGRAGAGARLPGRSAGARCRVRRRRRSASPALLEACWQTLRPGGRLVANAVTVEGEQRLLAWQTAARRRTAPHRGRAARSARQLPRLAPGAAGDPARRAQAVSSGRLLGVGVGPGDPELLTLKAVRVLSESPVIAYVSAAGRPSMARAHRRRRTLRRPDRRSRSPCRCGLVPELAAGRL